MISEEQYQRRAEDLITSLWPELENRLRRIMEDSLEKLELRIYERSFDPLKARVDQQEQFCAAHTQELTETKTLLHELTEAKLVRRLEVAEARISLIGKATTIIGGAAATALGGLIIGLITHSISI